MTDLESRVANRKRELIAEILDHKKNSSRFRATEEIDKLKERLAELADILRAGVVDWVKIGPRARVQLDSWLAK